MDEKTPFKKFEPNVHKVEDARLKEFSTPLHSLLSIQQYLMLIESVTVILEVPPIIGNIFPLIGV